LPYITHKKTVDSLAYDNDFDLMEYFNFLSISNNIKEKAEIGLKPFLDKLFNLRKKVNLLQYILKLLINTIVIFIKTIFF